MTFRKHTVVLNENSDKLIFRWVFSRGRVFGDVVTSILKPIVKVIHNTTSFPKSHLQIWEKNTEGIKVTIHPWRLTWNLKTSPWKRRFLLETIILRFYVKLWWLKDHAGLQGFNANVNAAKGIWEAFSAAHSGLSSGVKRAAARMAY